MLFLLLEDSNPGLLESDAKASPLEGNTKLSQALPSLPLLIPWPVVTPLLELGGGVYRGTANKQS